MLPWLDDDGDSDTGERDLPTCVDFELNRPIHKSEDIHIGHRRRFNRAGRAIIRIMAAHGWTTPAIGYVFVEEAKAVRRALENTTDDDLTQDYRHAPAEYRLKYPPKNPPLQSASAPATSANTPVMAPFIPSSLRATSVPTLPKSLAPPPAVAAWMSSTTSASSPSPPPESAPDPAPARPPKRKSVFDLGRRPPSAATITHMKLQYSLMLPPSHPCVAEAREAAANRPKAPSPPPLPSPLSPMRVLMRASVAEQESSPEPTSSSDVMKILQTTNVNNSPMSAKPRLQSSSLLIDSASPPNPVVATKHPLPTRPRKPLPLPKVKNTVLAMGGGTFRSHSFGANDSRPTSPSSAPLPRISSLPAANSSTLFAAPQTMDIVPHILKAKGFTTQRLHAFARWPAEERREALLRLLGAGPGAGPSLDAVERHLDLLLLQPPAPPAASRSLPHSNPAASELQTLLLPRPPYNIDLSEHTETLLARGFTKERLLAFKGADGWSRLAVKEFLARAFVDGSGAGLSALEVIVLEFTVRPEPM